MWDLFDLTKFSEYKEFTRIAINDSQRYQIVANVGMGLMFLVELSVNLIAIIVCYWLKSNKTFKSYIITQSFVYTYEALVIASEIVCNLKAAEVNFRRAHVRLFNKLNPFLYPLCILICIAFQLSDLFYVKNYMKFGDGSCFYAPYAFAEVCLDMDRNQRLVPSLEGTAIRFMFLNVFLSAFLYGYTFRQAWLRNAEKVEKAEKEDKDNPSQRSLWIYLMVLAINVSAVIERYWLFGDLQSRD
ncbi:unnamed protein product, partial [Mesorhabditis belari]|uniref:Uncharacterized protein n=1 Tax=Mesorhabditis belari TaxID=2138241 RepID=A0AAF3E8I1_9BILA